jgi:transposase
MKSLIASDEETVQALTTRLKQAQTIAEFQRVQCVLMRVALGSSAAQIAQVLGWATATVHVLHSRWAKEGDSLFDLKGKGGRKHQHLSEAQESELLAGFTQPAGTGGLLKVATVRRAFEHQVGKAVAHSTVYRLLKRHGWRKVAPRPRHPKADVAAQGAFKKSSAGSSAGKSAAKPRASAA